MTGMVEIVGPEDQQLGWLELVDPRSIWSHEALNFTPWLAQNAGRLAEALGIELEFEAGWSPPGSVLRPRPVPADRPAACEALHTADPADGGSIGEFFAALGRDWLVTSASWPGSPQPCRLRSTRAGCCRRWQLWRARAPPACAARTLCWPPGSRPPSWPLPLIPPAVMLTARRVVSPPAWPSDAPFGGSGAGGRPFPGRT